MDMIQLDMLDPIHISLLKESQRIKQEVQPLLDKAKSLQEEAYALCPHEVLEYKKLWHPGGYLDVDYTVHRKNCVFCGKTIQEWETSGGHYG